jgi:hypothetical protein
MPRKQEKVLIVRVLESLYNPRLYSNRMWISRDVANYRGSPDV